MRKITIATIVVALVGGAAAYVILAKPFRPDIGKLERLSNKWMEDLQFKDFRSSSLYHHKLDRNRVDIGRALERLFLVKPELLDIKDYRIVDTHIDSTGSRARVRIKAKYQRLNKDEKPQEADLMLYWMKRHPDCPIGAKCKAGACIDEFGDRIEKVEDAGETKHLSKKAPEPAEAGDETYACDPKAERAWFMNLDSTLDEKPYQRD